MNSWGPFWIAINAGYGIYSFGVENYYAAGFNSAIAIFLFCIMVDKSK